MAQSRFLQLRATLNSLGDLNHTRLLVEHLIEKCEAYLKMERGLDSSLSFYDEKDMVTNWFLHREKNLATEIANLAIDKKEIPIAKEKEYRIVRAIDEFWLAEDMGFEREVKTLDAAIILAVIC